MAKHKIVKKPDVFSVASGSGRGKKEEEAGERREGLTLGQDVGCFGHQARDSELFSKREGEG